ncbi:MAG: hypothetical protein ACYC9L_14160 [Sulfuricaulis sp.]
MRALQARYDAANDRADACANLTVKAAQILFEAGDLDIGDFEDVLNCEPT